MFISRTSCRTPRHHRLYVSLLAAGLITAVPISAEAAAFVVDTLLDTADANPGNGVALDSQGRTSLRAAIQEANALTGAHSISFAASLVSAGDATISLSAFDTGQDAGELGATAFIIDNNTQVTVTGPSGDNGITIERAAAASGFRFFHVRQTASSLSLSNLTFSNGLAQGGNGGAAGGGGGGGAGLGGAILNEGTLTLDAVTLTNNRAQGGAGNNGCGSTLCGGGGGGGGTGQSGGNGGNDNSPTGGTGGNPNGGAGGNIAQPGVGGGTGGGGGGGGGHNVVGGSGVGRAGGSGGRFGGGGGGGGAGGTGGGQTATGGNGAIGGFGGGGGGGGKARAFGGNTGGSGAAGGFGGGAGTAGEGGDSGQSGDGGGGAGMGGAIFNNGGALTLRNSTISGNTATGGGSQSISLYGGGSPANGGAGSGLGGAIFSTNRGGTAASLDIRHSTIAGNTVAAGATNGVAGGADAAIYVLGDGGNSTLSLNNSIVADTSGGSDVRVNTINAGSASGNGAGNLIESQTGFAGGIVTSADPNLAALADNRGPSLTRALNEGSPAVDSGDAGQIDGLAFDQRGGIFTRIADGDLNGSSLVDIGAFELHPIDYGDAPDFVSGIGPVEVLLEQGTDDQRISFVGANGNTSFSSTGPRAAYNATANEYLVVWSGDDVTDNEFEIWGQRLDGSTRQAVGGEFRISTMGPDGDTAYRANTPDVAWSSTSNEYLVTWQGDTNTVGDDDFEVFGRFVDATGGLQGTQLRLSQMGAAMDTNARADDPRVAYSATSGQFLVVWRGDEPVAPLVDNEFEIFGQRVSAATRDLSGSRMQISFMGGANGETNFFASNPAVAWNSATNEYLVAWQADDESGGVIDNETEIFGRFVAGGGTPLGATQFRISQMGPDGDVNYRGNNPALAYNADDNQFLAVWYGDDDDASLVDNEIEIFGQRLAGATGAAVGSFFRISDMGPVNNTNFFALNPAASYNPATGNYLVAWNGDELVDNDTEIWARRVAADGTVLDADEVRLSTMGPDGSTMFSAFNPVLAFNGTNGESLVVWNGDDDTAPLVNDEQEVFGQFLIDAPLVDYRTRGADDGPAHRRSAGLTLGAITDSDPDGQSSLEADGDDVNGLDDEESTTGLIEFAGIAPTLTLNVTNTTGGAATLFGWIDYDGDGEFENATERGSVSVPDGSNGADVQLTLPAPPVNPAVNTFARFRLSGDMAAANATGLATGGEVEDYPAIYNVDTLPDAFDFTNQTNVPLSSLITSAPITVSGINAATPITVSSGTYSINGGSFTAGAGNVMPGDEVRAQHTSSASFATAVGTTVTIGGVFDTFTSTTQAQDTAPDAFTFTDVTNVTPSTVQTSNTITVAGINSPAAISVTGGTYSINGGAFVSTPGTVSNGQTVAVRHTSSASSATATDTTLTIGGVSDTFTSTTFTIDTTPTAFSFTDATNVALSTVQTSNTITVAGINSPAPISVTGGTYSINGGSFVSTAGNVSNGQTVAVRHTSSASFGTATNTALTIGGVSDTFTSTTLAQDTTPAAFSFTDATNVARSTVQTSNTITVSGINSPAPISITGGTYSINGGAFVSTAGTVSNGQTVAVRHTSSANFGTATNTALTIGGVSDTFTSTTLAADSTPTAFSFVDQTGVVPNTVITSAAITIAGINTTAAISVTGGSYSINGGSFVTTAGTVVAGDQVQARHTSSASANTATNTVVTVGGVSDTFTSTTLANGANAAISKTDGRTSFGPGETLVYTIVVNNAGNVALTNATVTDTLPAAFASATWTCAASGAATCTASGSGSIADSVNLPIGTSVTYALTAVPTASFVGQVSNTATVALTGGQVDVAPANNSATDTTSSTRIFRDGFE